MFKKLLLKFGLIKGFKSVLQILIAHLLIAYSSAGQCREDRLEEGHFPLETTDLTEEIKYRLTGILHPSIPSVLQTPVGKKRKSYC